MYLQYVVICNKVIFHSIKTAEFSHFPAFNHSGETDLADPLIICWAVSPSLVILSKFIVKLIIYNGAGFCQQLYVEHVSNVEQL